LFVHKDIVAVFFVYICLCQLYIKVLFWGPVPVWSSYRNESHLDKKWRY